jgi:3-hydroxyacyl-CoA dehydrogenase/enoyl-CoA hydratase/3-hydroxybutyryl-CoA epimerase
MRTAIPIQENGPRTAQYGDAAFEPVIVRSSNIAMPPSGIQRVVAEEGVCILTFDRPGSSANVFDRTTLVELQEHLCFIEHHPEIRGVVIASAKDTIFVAGADLHALSAASRDELLVLIELGQEVFNRLASLSVPTVAAIHGACVGGGFEMALACRYRIATSDRVTKIGLPETQLGILPAWGGSTRLPRLVGLPGALDIILGGKTLSAQQALKRGLVDYLVPRERMLEFARQHLFGDRTVKCRRAGPLKLWALNNRMVSTMTRSRVKQQLVKRTRGHYPAVTRARDIVTTSVHLSVALSLELERRAILELAATPEASNLIRLFLLQEKAKKRGTVPRVEATDSQSIRHTAVIGAGVMGSGIAHWVSSRGWPVILRDVGVEPVRKGMESIRRLYSDGVRRHSLTRLEARSGLDRISPAVGETPLGQVDLVIEAAVERLPEKKDIFAGLDRLTRSDTILATNTSALSVTEIANSTRMPERVVGIHFFNPVHRMQLVEVVAGRQTSTETIRRTLRFVQQIGKLPVLVKDSPGFLVNRILMPYLVEAGRLVECGASVKNVDEAMSGFGMPMGPLRLIDEIGADVAIHVAETLGAHFGERLGVPPILSDMLRSGLLGRKTGRGFYQHDQKRECESNPEIAKFQKGDRARFLPMDQLATRMVVLMINEAARCLEEMIVTEPDDVDFAMILGTGFAPFRGGPLRYADATGVGNIVGELRRLADSEGNAFAPCRLLEEMAERGAKFHG